jgi:hypothetical protein
MLAQELLPDERLPVTNPRGWSSGLLPGRRKVATPVNTRVFIVNYLENRCKLTLNECIALFPTVEIFQAVWF